MKDLGITTIISVAAIAAAPGAQGSRPVALATAKPMQAFDDCFARTQQRFGQPSSLVAKKNGGTFPNLGGPSVREPHLVVLSDGGPRREIRNGAEAPEVVQCI
jgi:hypothetical protein